jgi:hypothetical protein
MQMECNVCQLPLVDNRGEQNAGQRWWVNRVKDTQVYLPKLPLLIVNRAPPIQGLAR